MLRHRTEESEYDRDTFKAVESSLLTQVSDLSAYVFLLLAASSLTCAVMFVSRQVSVMLFFFCYWQSSNLNRSQIWRLK